MDRTNELLVAAFAEVLRDARGQAGLTQEDLAERADVSVRFISMLETGKRQPSLSALAAVSGGLGMPMSALVMAVEERLGRWWTGGWHWRRRVRSGHHGPDGVAGRNSAAVVW